MSNVAKITADLIKGATYKKAQAMSMANFVKAGKVNKYVETLTAMVADGHSIFCFCSDSAIYLTLTISDLDSFKGERIQGILTALEYLNPSSQGVQEYAAELNKDFTYRFSHKSAVSDVPDVTVIVVLQAYAKSDSDTCKKVITGYTDGKPQPIYKIECSDADEGGTDTGRMPAEYVSPSVEGY